MSNQHDINNSQNVKNIFLEKYLALSTMREIIDNSVMNDFSIDIVEKRRKVANKILDMANIYDDDFKLGFVCDQIDKIDVDMLDVGHIEGKKLKIDIFPITTDIDLSRLIRNAFLERKINFIRMLMSRNIDIFNIEPRIMIMCTETDQDELMSDLIDKKIHIHTDQYRCVYRLAADGKLALIKKIMKNYCFPDALEIISKTCIQAIYNNHVHILKYFLRADAFIGLPDYMFCMFINSIEYGGHLDIIKFFVESGINIRQDNYLAVHQAIKFNKPDIIKYFYDSDIIVDTILTTEQKDKYNLGKIIMLKQYIGTNQSCNISYDDINEGDTYYQCNKNLHYFLSDKWIEWCKNRSNNKPIIGVETVNFCPLCFSPIKKILYINIK